MKTALFWRPPTAAEAANAARAQPISPAQRTGGLRESQAGGAGARRLRA